MYILDDRFEWDAGKRISNLAKHDVDFIDATNIFDGEVAESVSKRGNLGEVRIRAVGKVNNKILHVVYTWRENRRRIISARRAGRNEREEYYARILGRPS